MVLQAFVDDSGNDPRSHSFTLASFVAPSETWAKFSDDWQALLDRRPGAAYLKTTDAYALNEEFHKAKGWTRALRDKFMFDAADVIKSHVRERVAVWVRREHFDKHLKSLALPYSRDAAENPYFLCFYHLILTAAALHSITNSQPCDFIFDDQSAVGERALSWWGMFKHNAAHGSNTNFSPFLGSPPRFGDEKKFKPLQAADFYAWHMNRWIFQNKKIIMPRPKPLLRLEPMRCIEYEFTEPKIIQLREFLVEIGHKFSAANPTASLSTSSPKRRPRAKWYPSGV